MRPSVRFNGKTPEREAPGLVWGRVAPNPPDLPDESDHRNDQDIR